jgi:hypothetical protein
MSGAGQHRICCCTGTPYASCEYDQSTRGSFVSPPHPESLPINFFPTKLRVSLPNELPYIHYMDWASLRGLFGGFQFVGGPFVRCVNSPSTLILEGECGQSCLEPGCWTGEDRRFAIGQTWWGENQGAIGSDPYYWGPNIWNRAPSSVWTRRFIFNQYHVWPRPDFTVPANEDEGYPPGMNFCGDGPLSYRAILLRELEQYDQAADPNEMIFAVWDECTIWVQFAMPYLGNWFISVEVRFTARNLAGFLTCNKYLDAGVDDRTWDWVNPNLFPTAWLFGHGRFAPWYYSDDFEWYGLDPQTWQGSQLRAFWGGSSYADWCWSSNGHPWQNYYINQCLADKGLETFNFSAEPDNGAITVADCPDPCAQGTSSRIVTGLGLYVPVGTPEICGLACDA